MLKKLDFFLKYMVFIFWFLVFVKKIWCRRRNSSKLRVAFIKLSAFGDVLKLADVITNLNIDFEKYQLDLITTEKSNPKFFTYVDVFSEVKTLNPISLIAFLCKNSLIDQYDIILDLDQYYMISGCIALTNSISGGFRSEAKKLPTTYVVDYDPNGSEYENFSKLICNVLDVDRPAIEKNLLKPLKLIIPTRRDFGKLGSNLILLYPGSSQNAKYRRWPIARFIELAKELHPKYNVRFVGGPDELDLCNNIEESGLGFLNLINQLTLQELCCIFRENTALFVGNDAGLLHLADSQRVPCYGVYGPNLSEKWGAATPGSKGFWQETDCRPCIKNGSGQIPNSCALGEPICVLGVSAQNVADEIKNFMRRYR